MTDLPARLRAVVPELKRYLRHRPECAYREEYTDDGGYEDMARPYTYSARPCDCGLNARVADLDALLGALETEPRRGDFEALFADLKELMNLYDTDRVASQHARQIERIFDKWLGEDPGAVGRAEPPDGWQQEQSQMKLDAKFYGTIIKAKDATIVPDDEYVVFLAKDNAFADVLPLYIRACIERNCDAEQIDAAQAMYDRLCQWRAAHPERLKNPDAKGERLLPPVTERRAP